jgi:exodeoxyribonuclease V alpha subunit
LSETIVAKRLRVTSVRSRGKSGGAIFSGKCDSGDQFVVIADYSLLPDSSFVERAQVWTVEGLARDVCYSINGRNRTEIEIRAQRLELQHPSGANLVAWIAASPECPGIGEVRARRLWERFGVDLPEIVDSGDVERLQEILSHEQAKVLVDAFAKNGMSRALVWLDQMGLPRHIAASVARYWGKDAPQMVRSDPYALLSFCADWRTVDELGRKRFGITGDDPRRIAAAVEEVLYRAMDRGHTALATGVVYSRLRKFIGADVHTDQAVAIAANSGRVLESAGLLQTAGLARIEEGIASALVAILDGTPREHAELFPAALPEAADVEASVRLYESMHGIELTSEQREAVLKCATHRVSCILGGAGTGKTTVLKALCHAIDRTAPGIKIHQLALAGRAAQRMTEATGRESKTIASFLLDEAVSPGATVLIDEMSMVDAILMYRVVRHLPDGVRLVLIGDPSQLAPIGPGLVLHALAELPPIPQTTLKTVKRQSAASGIPQVAAAIREHQPPEWTTYVGKGTGVSVVPCAAGKIDLTVARIYEELGGTGLDYTVQVLAATRNGFGGVRGLNELLQRSTAPMKQAILSVHREFGPLQESTGDGLKLFVDDLVMFCANDYTLGLRNGALGRIVRAVPSGGTETPVCVAEFDGALYELTAGHLRNVCHSYAVTIHKAQGSQFSRVIVPVRRTKVLDNSLVYTAVTRGIDQVVIVGDLEAAEETIVSPATASLRTTRFSALLKAACQDR